MKSKLLLASIVILFCQFSMVSSQAQQVWQKAIGLNFDYECYSIIQTIDKGYALGGTCDSVGAGNYDFYVAKLDSTGTLQWTRTIGGAGISEGYSIVQTKDKGYALAGSTNAYGEGAWDFYVAKLDSGGIVQWTKTIGGGGNEKCYSIIQTKDGGYAMSGYTDTYGAGGYDAYVVKLDSSGNLKWTKTVGGSGTEVAYSLTQTNDGGFAFCGWTSSYGGGGFHEYVAKLDTGGSLLWTKTIGGGGFDKGYSIIQTIDKGYAICGLTNSFGAGNFDAYVVKLDSSANIQWTKTIGGTAYDYGSSMVQTKDGGYAICGWSNSFGAGDEDYYVIKLDSNGALQLSKTIGGNADDDSFSIIQTDDGGYAVCGWSGSFTANGYDLYVVKLDSSFNGCAYVKTVVSTADTGGVASSGGTEASGGILQTITAISTSSGYAKDPCQMVGINTSEEKNILEIYPNPMITSATLQFNSSSKDAQVAVCDVLGNEMIRSRMNGDKIDIKRGNLESGIYFLKLNDGDRIYVKKLIVE